MSAPPLSTGDMLSLLLQVGAREAQLVVAVFAGARGERSRKPPRPPTCVLWVLTSSGAAVPPGQCALAPFHAVFPALFPSSRTAPFPSNFLVLRVCRANGAGLLAGTGLACTRGEPGFRLGFRLG